MALLGEPRTRPWRRRRVAHAALAVAGIALLTLALLHVAGYRPLVVHSDSMAPSVASGDLIVTRAVAPTTVAVGDVVSFHDRSRADRLVTHRVKEIRRQGGEVMVVTRGDANGTLERWSSDADARIGRLALRIPVAGYAVIWLTRPPIIVALLAIVALLLAQAIVGARAAPGARRAVSRSLLAALASSATIVTIPLTLAATEGAFSAVTANAANSFQAASSFCPAGPQTVVADADSYVTQESPNVNDGGDAAIQVVSEASKNVRSLVRFPLPATPADCTVTSAVLRLKVFIVSWSGRTLQASRVTGPWSENTITWNNQPISTPTDLATTASGSGTVSFDVTAQLASMYAGTNNGFLIRDGAEDGFGAIQVYSSRENGSNGPTLVVTYG